MPASDTVTSMSSSIIPDNPPEIAEFKKANSPRLSDFSFGTGFQLSTHFPNNQDNVTPKFASFP
jgi:hypothetical protein